MPSFARTDSQATSADVANRILRRSHVSKMTRELQKRLALANVKIKHGWERMSFDTIEPQVEKELKRKRSLSPTAVGPDPRSVFARANSSSPSVRSFSGKEASSEAGSSSGSSAKRPRFHSKASRSSPTTQPKLLMSEKSTHEASSLGLPAQSHVSPRHVFLNKPPHSASVTYGSSTSPLPLDSDDGSPYSSETDDEDLPLPQPHPRELKPRVSTATMSSFAYSHNSLRSSPPPMGTPKDPFLCAPYDATIQPRRLEKSSSYSSFMLNESVSSMPLGFLNTTLSQHSTDSPISPPTSFSSTFMSVSGEDCPEFTPLTSGFGFQFDEFFNVSPHSMSTSWRNSCSTQKTVRPPPEQPSANVFADPLLTSTSTSLFGDTLELSEF